MKSTLAAALFAVTASAIAPAAIANTDVFGLSPEACAESVSYFMVDRLYDSRSARVSLTGEPYRVMVDLRDGQQVTAWAQNVHIKSRLPSGSWSNQQPFTVIFKNGQAIALESEVRGMTPV